MDDTKQLRELQVFLIRKFLMSMLVVGIAEYLLSMIYNYALIPFLWKFLFAGTDFSGIGAPGILPIFLLLLESLFLGVLNAALPGRIQQLMTDGLLFAGKSLGAGNESAVAAMPLPLQDLGFSKRMLLFILLLGMLFLLILPFFWGAIHFSRIVIAQFRIIEARQVAKQREYEQKRNLMLSDIAHDLRTPITTVNGYAKALSDGLIPEDKKQEYLDAIMNKASRINELITYLFEYVKTDSAGFSLKREDTDICELVRECAALSYQDAEDAGMELNVEIPEEVIDLSVDKLQFSRTVTNLLTNAMRHNGAGTKIGVILSGDKKKGLSLYVADDGDAIEKEIAEHLFEPFVTADESRSTKGGSGLGLSIAKRIMELHGFTISLLQEKELAAHKEAAAYRKAFLIEMK